MEIPDLILVGIILGVTIFTYSQINPKLDWNYETHERILWYNDVFDKGVRKYIILYKGNPNNDS